MPLLFESVTTGSATLFTASTRPCNESFVLVPSVAPSGSALTAASAAAFVVSTALFSSFSCSAILSASAWLTSPFPSSSTPSTSFCAAFWASSAAFTFSSASVIAASSLSLMPLLSASVTVGTVTSFTLSTRVCNDAGVLPSASFAPSGSALTALSAAFLASATFSFNAAIASASAWLIRPSLFASAFANASSASFSAASAAFTFSSALAILLVFTTTSSPGLPPH